MSFDLDELRITVSKWAADYPEIEAAWLYGSRAKGVAHAGSDIDIGVQMAADDPGDALGDFICLAPRWRASLGPLLSAPLDLRLAYDAEGVTLPAIREHGVLLYQR